LESDEVGEDAPGEKCEDRVDDPDGPCLVGARQRSRTFVNDPRGGSLRKPEKAAEVTMPPPPQLYPPPFGRKTEGRYNRGVQKNSFGKQAKFFFGGFAAIYNFLPGRKGTTGRGAWDSFTTSNRIEMGAHHRHMYIIDLHPGPTK